MDHSTFIAIVEDYAGVRRREAHEATRATLEALAERLSSGEARIVAGELPDELRPFLDAGGEARKLDIHQFLRRVAALEHAPVPTAARHARAVFTALGRALSDRVRKELAGQLPQDYRVLIEALRPERAHIQPPPPDELPGGDFVQSTSDKLGVDHATAWHAIDAVLEMLARRVSHGEVDDLIIRLPSALAGPLEYGVTAGGEQAQPLPVEIFVRGIVEAERVTPREAIEHARAVFATLREYVGEKELSDVLAQLPKDYDVLLPFEDESEDAVAIQVVELVEVVEYVKAPGPT
jgi:uncharacterized protein (DUF2267 family)